MVKGSHLTTEQKARISAGLKGRVFSAEHRARLGAASRGRQASEETRRKIGDASRARMADPTYKARINAGKISRAWTPEQRARRSEIARNAAPSKRPEVRAKIGAAARRRYEQITERQAQRRRRLEPVVIGVCVYCLDPATQLDHVIPPSLGGTNDPENLAPACQPCNASKSDLPLEAWLLLTAGGMRATARRLASQTSSAFVLRVGDAAGLAW